jgi:glyoxylase-like metal-dependent hydrolase (beta-lactamase superfamily II)
MPVKINVGDAEIISLTDLTMQFPWSMFFPNVAVADIEAYQDLYPQCYGPGMFKTDAGAYAIRSGGKTVVVDTGLGPGPIAMLGNITGNLIPDMKAKGIAPEDVDVVVHTHLHLDHVGWNCDADGKPNFPNATYYAPEKDVEFFFANKASNPHIETQVEPLQKLGKLETFSGEVTLAPNVTTFDTPGHTPGHASVIVGSGGDYAFIAGDVAHHPCQVDRPEWSGAFDTDGTQSAETRKKIVDRLEKDGAIAAFCHFPQEFGKIAKQGNRRVFQAL